MSSQTKKNKANLPGLLLIVMIASFSIAAEGTDSNDPVVTETSIETSQTLFNGELGEEWNELAAYGGDFKKFARVEDNVLLVEVPEGNEWGKTGIRSAEPLVTFPEKGETSARKLTFTIDQKRSSDFILAIIPSNWDGNLEWRSHQIRVGLLTNEASENSSLTLWIRGAEIMKVDLDPDSIQQFSIIMRPDRLILVTDADNKILLQGYMPENHKIFEEGYRISVLAHAPKKGMAAKLALKEITLEDLPYEPAKREDNPTIWLDKSQNTVLFDGRILDKHWIKYQTGAGSNFAQQAHFTRDALLVDVPKGVGWGKVGIMSPEPLVWLDKFGKGAEVRVTYQFDPQQTTGFVIALASSNAPAGNEPSDPRALLFLRKDLNKNIIKASLYLTPNKNWKPVWEEEIPNKMPEEVSFTLTPGVLTVEASGILKNDTPWVLAAPSQSFRVYAYSQPEEHKAPVKMALKRISLERKAAETIKTPTPQKGVAPLPVKVLFDGKLNEWWEEAGIEGAEFSKFGRFENNQMIVDVPEKVSGWASTGLLSKKPIIDFNERILSTSHQLKFKVDKQQTTGFEVMFHSGKYANMYGGNTSAMVRFTYCSEGSCAGKYILLLRINFNPHRVWSREVDADWVENEWDGVISIEIGNGWVAAHLLNGPAVRSYDFSIGKNSKLYMTVYSRNHERGGPAKLALEKITSEWVAPDGMTKMDRFLYVDDEDFDASDFLDELNNELSELDKEE